jgi:hypothetical protein
MNGVLRPVGQTSATRAVKASRRYSDVRYASRVTITSRVSVDNVFNFRCATRPAAAESRSVRPVAGVSDMGRVMESDDWDSGPSCVK